MTTAPKRLLYFADPMCSWCWGFTSVIEQIRKEFGEGAQSTEEGAVLELITGGLRPGAAEPLDPGLRQEILHHWQAVQRHTGQAFNFDNALPAGFVYDTEPASRAVVLIKQQCPASVLAFFSSVQEAFYVHKQDVTREAVLSELAAPYLDAQEFARCFHSPALTEATWQQFELSRRYGVRGFPTLLLDNGAETHLICHGYLPYSDVKSRLDSCLAIESY